MLSVFKASQLVILVAALGLADGARAESSPDADAPADLAKRESTKCVEIGSDEALDIVLVKNLTDIWSREANASIGNSQGEVTLLVATRYESGYFGVRVEFEAMEEFVTLSDGNTEVRLIPDPEGSASTSFPFRVGTTISVVATSSAGIEGYKPPASNKAVLKPVTTCPKT